jgi:transposase
MLRLNERERNLLTLHLKGASIGAIAEKLDLSYEAARKALGRAIERARSLADGSSRTVHRRGLGDS